MSDEPDWREIGRTVTERRQELGMETQQDLADAAGVHVNTVSRTERGIPSSRRSPAWPKLEAALKWPAGHISRLADGYTVSEHPIPAEMGQEISQAVLAAVSDAAPDVTMRQARSIADGTVKELRRRGLLPSDTAGLTSGSQ